PARRGARAPPLLLEDEGDVLGRHHRVVVHGDDDVPGDQVLGAGLLGRRHLDLPGRHAPDLLGQVEAAVVRVLLEVLIGPVTRVAFVGSHGWPPWRRHYSTAFVASAFASQDSIPISRYIAAAVARWSRAFAGSAARA